METVVAKSSAQLVRERLCLSGIFFLHGAIFASWAGRIPQLQQHLHLSNGNLGLSLLCLAIGALLAMPSAGALGHVHGSGQTTKVFSFAMLFMLTMLPLAPNWLMFSGLLFLFGFSLGGMDVSMNAHAVAVERRFGRQIMSAFHGMFSMGGMAGAGLSVWMCNLTMSPLDHFLRFAMVAVPLLAVMCWFINDEPNEHMDSPMFVLPDRRVAALGLIAFCSFIGEGAIADWSAVYMNTSLGASPALSAAGFTVFCLTMTIFRFFGDKLVDRLGARAILMGGGTLSALGIFGTLMAQSPEVALIFYALVGVGFACLVPVVFSSAGREAQGSASTAIAGVATLGYFGFVIAPPIIGQLADLISLRMALMLPVVLSLLIVVLAGPALKRQQPKEAG